MKILLAFSVLLLASVASGKVITTAYNSIDEFTALYPDVKLIELISEDFEVDGSRSYSLGARQTGDSVVANANNKKSWPQSQNVTTTLTYPSPGTTGAYLTFVLVNCEQASNLGRAYITYGGVQQHFIQIIIEAQLTSYFNYAAFFYGIK